MKLYTYKFADGTTRTVEVGGELFCFLVEMDKQERKENRRENRRHVSLEMLAEMNVEPSYTDKYFSENIFDVIEDERLYSALKTLTEKQRNVFISVVIDGISFRELARQKGLNKDTVREQFIAAKEKVIKFFVNTPPKHLFSWL